MIGRYTLTLTADEVETIAFVGDRYQWACWASRLSEGVNSLHEHEAWEFREAIEADMEGGHSPFPLLSEDSDLYTKLNALIDSIV